MDISNILELASANIPDQEKQITDHEAQFKLLMDTAEIHKTKKDYANAEKDLIHAFMQRVILDNGVDSAGMLDILRLLSDVFVSNKHKHLVEITKELILKFEEKLKEIVVESHFFIEVLFEIAKGYYAKDNSKLGHEIMKFIIKKLTELEGEHTYLLSNFYTTNGEAYRHENLYNEAISCHELALAIRRGADAKLDENDDKDMIEIIKHDLAETLSSLGFCYRSAIKYDESEKYYEEALAIRREHLRHVGPLIGKSYNDLAELFRDKKDYEKAIRYHIAAVEIFTRFFAPDHPRVVNAKGNYGVTLNHQSRHSFEHGSGMVKEAIAYFIANKYASDHVWVVKFRAELAIENTQHEMEVLKKRVKKFQTEQVLKEIEERLQHKKYEQLTEKIKNKDSEHRNEMNKIKFMNSVLTEQLALNKSTTNNLLIENNDLLEKIETLIAKQKLTESQHEEENNKMQDIFSELLSKTEDLEAKDVRFQLEEERLLQENDVMNSRDDERLTEIESLGGKIWELEKELKVALYQKSQLQEEMATYQIDVEEYKNAPPIIIEIVKPETEDHSDQTDILFPNQQGYLEAMSQSMTEDCVTAAMEGTEALVEAKKIRNSNALARKALYVPNDTEEFVRHQYPPREEEEELSEEQIRAAADAKTILDLSVSLKMEEMMSTTAFSLLEEKNVSADAEMAECVSKHETALEEVLTRLSLVQTELLESQASNKANEDELAVLAAFMKEHDLDPKKTKLKALKAKVSRLEDETTAQRYKIDELETELFTLKIEHDQVVNENDQNSRTAMEVTDTNHLLTLQLKAANYEIEHMSAELHLDRHKLAESQRDVEEKSVELDEQVKKLSMCDENCSSLRGTIEDRDCTINNLEDIILDLKGIPRKEKNQIFEKKKRIEEEGETEKKEEEEKEEQNPDSNTCFLTDLDVDVHMEQVSPPVPSPTRVGFLPALEGGSKTSPRPHPDDKSTSEGGNSPSHRVNFLKPIALDKDTDKDMTDDLSEGGGTGVKEESSSDFAEVLFLAPPRTPKNLAAIKKAKHTKDKDKYLKIQKHYCTMCDQKVKGAPKVIPTSLQNVLQPGESFDTVSTSKNSKEGSTKEFQLAGFPKSSKNYLDSQVIWRESYSTRGEDCIFCCWDCARDWNKKYTPVNYRYTTLKLIDIAAGKFIT